MVLTLLVAASVACLEPNPNADVGTSDAEGEASSTTESTGGQDTTETGGDPLCADYEGQDACEADGSCLAIVGIPLKENGQGAPCLEPAEFLGCIESQACGEAETWFCVGANAKPYLLGDTCGPEGAAECDPGVEDPPTCG